MAEKTGDSHEVMAERNIRERIDREITSLNKMDSYSERDRKLPWYKNLLRKLIGWYVNPIMEKQWSSNQKLVVILEELCRDNQALREKLDAAETSSVENDKRWETNAAAQMKRNEEESEKRREFETLVKETGNMLEQRVLDIEKREVWTRERFEGQDAKFESLRIFEDWVRGRFDGQEERLESLRIFEEWVRSQLDHCERNLTNKKELEAWINSKYNEFYALLLKKIENNEKRIEDLKAATEGFMIHSNRSYSQSGEDAIMGYLLNFMQIDLANLTYLDLGANHAKEMSNTYYLYEKGVRGVIVEANPELIPELKALREGDTILNRVIVPEISSPQERFYLVNGDGISGFDYERVLAACRSNPELKITGDVLVTAITIDMLIEQYLQPDKLFVLSIDIEGIEETILRQIQWDAIRPVIVIVEAIEYRPYLVTGKAESGIETFMKQKDYVEYAFTGINSIYVDRKYVQYINDKIIEGLQQKN